MKKQKPTIEMVAVDEIKAQVHTKNPRVHPDMAIAKLAESIREFGWTNPVLTDKEGRVLAGHARIKAAIKAGIKEIPVIRLNHLSGKKADAYLIADNRLAQDTFWDGEILKDLLSGIKAAGEFDLMITGFSSHELDEILNEQVKPEVPPEPKTKTRPLITCPECGHEF